MQMIMDKIKLPYNKINTLSVIIGLLCTILLLPAISVAQNGKISVTAIGTVKDADGEPLEGVLVNISEKNVIAFTNATGNFSITAGIDDYLLFSLEGFQNVQMKVDANEPMIIVMQTGSGEKGHIIELPYRTAPWEQSLASVSTVNGRRLEKQPVTFLDLTLAGNLSGVAIRENRSEPGWNYYLLSFVRGLRTFGTQGSATGFGGEGEEGNANKPLFIIDNVERELTTMDAYSIESITVLKDLASTSLYGQRGGNGVIFVTTRRGEAGRTRINVNQEVSMQSVLKQPVFETSAEYAESYNRAQQLDGVTNLKFSQEDIDLYRSGESPWTHPNTDWFDLIIRDYAPQYKTNLNISGGNNTARYFISMTYTHQESIYDKKWTSWNKDWTTDHKLDRWNFRSNIDVNVNRNLNVALDLGGRLDVINQPASINDGGVWQIFTAAWECKPTWLWQNPNGTWAAGWPDMGWGAEHRNPLAKIAEWGYEQNFKRSIYTNVRANYKLDFLLKGLSARTLIAFDSYNSFWIERSQRPAMYRWNPADDSYTQVSAEIPLTLNRSQARDMNYKTDVNFIVDYSRTFGNHSLSAMGLYRQIILNKVGMTARWSNLAFAGKVNYAFKNRYLAEASVTRMGIDNYVKGERFGTFPSFSAGWIASNEDFLKDNNTISFLKLRASWGMAGNDRTRARRYPYTDIYASGTGYNFGGLSGTNYGGYVESQAGNKLIKWETSEMTNLGVDVSFWNDALYANIDLFKESRWGILIDRTTMPSLYGMTPPLDPYGEVENKGGELAIGTRAKAGDFRFNIELTASFTRNKITEMDELETPEPYMSLTGYPIGQMIGYRFDKYFESYEEIANSPVQELGTANLKPGNIKWKDLNNDGVVNANDRDRFGKGTGFEHPDDWQGWISLPEYLVGGFIGVNYKGFEINALIYGELNRTVEIPRNIHNGLQWSGTFTPLIRESWGYYTEDPADDRNINAKWPRMSADATRYENDIRYNSADPSSTFSDFWWRDGDFIRLRNLEIAYTLPTKLTQKAGISNLRIFANGYNMFAWDNLNLPVDPETPKNAVWGYPKTKTMSIGLNLTF